MNQPPIDNQFVQPDCEQFTSDTPKTDLAYSGPPETVVARLRELSCGLERQVDRLCRERENISDFNAGWHKEMTSRNAELELKVIEAENELESMRSKIPYTMNQPAPSDTPTPRTDALINRLKHFWYMGVSCSVEIANFCKVLERELTHLSAEREGEREPFKCKCVEQGYAEQDCPTHGEVAQLREMVAELEGRLSTTLQISEVIEKEVKAMREWNKLSEVEIANLRDINEANEDRLDLMRDEFQRIKAIGSDEIKGLCERAISDIEQNVPVIVQRDNALATLAERDRQLAEVEAELKTIRESVARRFQIDAQCIEALESAGMGAPGNPNTIVAMVLEAVAQLAASERQRKEMEGKLKVAEDALLREHAAKARESL